MLTKVLAVVFAIAIPAVGGTVYLAAGGKCPFSCSDQPTCSASAVSAEETAGCCSTPSRTSCCTSDEAGGCCAGESEATTEVLNVMPREVK